ncbi:MAG TPA: DNA-processing protein DprA [Gemmatimonadaceae bacterium]|nr:DNA-processing protein DprA [Gemmatimonadaceae bacterium]
MISSSPDGAERRAALALSLISGVGPVRFGELIDDFATPSAAFRSRSSASEREQALAEADRLLERASRAGARLVVRGQPGYPEKLAELPQPPSCLWLRGNSDWLDAPCIGIVGTRHPTPYGERVARDLAAALARAGAVIVSGLALGIDGVAHRAALDAGGGSIGVLGTGVDVAYPRAHASLHAQLAGNGLLVSEEPPGARATPGSFPKRNRIIAALSTAVVIVEADHDSGALITAGHALELARSVAAVPGPIDSPRSNGANRLLRDGAIVIAEAADALALVGLHAAPPRDLSGATRAEREIWKVLGQGATDMDALAAACDLPLRDCLAALTSLEMAGAVEFAPTGEIRRI